MHCELDLHIAAPFQGAVDEGRLRRAVEETLAAQGLDSAVELGLVISDDRVLRKLNRTFRGVDASTDVLAFGLRDEGFATPPDGLLHLGEVVISEPQAARQAWEQGHSLERELALLAIHGVLHLLGYDHEHPEKEQRMRAMEERVLASVFEESR